ncbi:uncharacterized protein ACNLHF_018592 isoform 1-T2 [Anomaloglossus baeobatrachus]|uniref:uncharacterized protein LOC142311192 n=1 Tax=Anomaloglossus baeobatrachus TaxID=238106 RepID=UPI003F4F6E8B
MPKCIVDYCHNYAGMRKNYANVILHGFPTTPDRIKTWLKSLEQGGQVFENLDEMAAKIHEGKKHDSYRVCSEHFSQQCYIVSGDKKVLNKNAVPTILTPCVTETRCTHKPEPLSRQAKEFMKKKEIEDSPQYSQEAKLCRKDNLNLVKRGGELTGIVLNLTLEIIYLLTGEDFALVKKPESLITEPPPPSPTPEKSNMEKIIKLTNKIIELLTGEVPIRCQDVTVHFSMEEWEYIEEHKDLYKDVIMKNHQNPTSPGLSCEQIQSLQHIPCSNRANPNKNSNRANQKSSCLKMIKKVKERVKNISKAANSCKEEDVSDANATYTHLSTFIKMEPVSSKEDDTDTCGYTHTNHIKENQCTLDMVDFIPSVLPDATRMTSADVVQNCPSTCIKEFASCNRENLMYHGTSIPTDTEIPHSLPPHIKVEYIPCEERSSTTANTNHTPVAPTHCNPAPHIKVDYILQEAEHTTPNIFYIPVDPIPCPSIIIKEEPAYFEEGDLMDTNIYTPKNHLQQHPYVHIKEEAETYDGGTATVTNVSLPRGHPQISPFTHIKDELLTLDERRVPDKTLPFTCTECSEGFTSKSDLAYHQTIHRIERLKCPECGKYFSNKSNLSNHIRSHTGEKPYSCPACGKRFTRKSTLIIHQRIHTGEKPFVCLECGRCFPGKGNLMKHQKVHKGKKSMTMKSFLPMPMTLLLDSNVAPFQMLQ